MPSWSPWGILVVPVFLGPVGQSIPAPAGEPMTAVTRSPTTKVYPRACGGTRISEERRTETGGLSPRLRGNRRGRWAGRPSAGSIPAPAGEPPGPVGWKTISGVYPRACGGTFRVKVLAPDLQGLSPRLRGNQRAGGDSVKNPRSIPAPAGEPKLRPAIQIPTSVYPRACGGTSVPCIMYRSSVGLSPRLRGNPVASPIPVTVNRSIPAPAGEPSLMASIESRIAVYPRACGGTRPA